MSRADVTDGSLHSSDPEAVKVGMLRRMVKNKMKRKMVWDEEVGRVMT